jgi:tRNA A-37 threonylcarbamoyl transferase component Bud32
MYIWFVGVPDEPSTELVAPTGTPPVEAAASSTLIGHTLGGRFTVVEQVGRGGSGEVFRAEQTQLGRSAVVKVLRRDVATTPNRVERFLREARLASRLDHPYAAHIYAFGAEEGDVLWIAMEHVRGITLDELVTKRGAMHAAVFAPLFVRLCEVVHTAHELDIVHRDIKGANVMVIERAGQLLPKLLDFGIAKSDVSADSPGVDDPELTAHGATLGSPHYMSPEQWQRPMDVDARADIYALGVLAYRCLAGYLPFHTRNRLELAAAHTSAPVPPMPDFVPAVLCDVVMRALEKDPAARWQSAVAFAQAIQHAAGTKPTEAVPIFDPTTRDAWLRAGPQPIADAVAHLTSAATTVEADAALRELVAITCRWLAVLALSGLPPSAGTGVDPRVREHARSIVGRDDGAPWLALARAAVAATLVPLPALAAALAGIEPLATLTDRLDDPSRARNAATLATDVAAAAEALLVIEPLLAYQLVVGGPDGIAESWQGPRRRDRDRVVVWGAPLAPGDVALLDAGGHVVARLSPFAQVIAPLPSAEPELFLVWRSGRGPARLVAAPWGFERDDDQTGHLLAALSTEDTETAQDDASERSPYPGLAAYGVDDARHFVGREREVEALANRLVRAPLLAVLGPSGVGKSSFIHAGLVARLADSHRVLTMRPGRHPMHALAAVSGDSADDARLVARLRELGERAPRGLVLVIDQLEELETLCVDPVERTRFAATIAAAAEGPSAPVRVVATLRDDFATVIESEAPIRGRFDVFVLAAPSPEALRRIVVEPARRANVTVDPRVVDDMVAEVAGRAASLPLLSFTAAQLWQTRDRAARKITYDAYRELGGVAGALATYADEIYGNLARRDQDTVRDLFARLVAVDGTRIPSPRRELEQLPGATGVLAHLIDARLLVVHDDDGVLEIVHECLAERWPRLARWRSEDAADRALLGDVRAAARRWLDGQRSPDLLGRGEALAELHRLAARSTALTDHERAFATESMRYQQRARRARRMLVAVVMALLAGVAVVMAYLGIAANDSRADAERNATRASASAKLAEERLTSSLVAQGKRELNDGRAMPALAYFGAALKRGADTPGLRAMISIASRGWRDILVEHRQATNAIAGSPNGWIVAGDPAGALRFWSDTGEVQGTVETGLGSISMIDRLADDGVLVVGQHGVVQLDKAHQRVRGVALDAPAWMGRLGPGTDEVITVQSGSITVWGFDGTVRRKVPLGTAPDAYEPQISADGHHALVGHGDVLELVDLATLRRTPITKQAAGAPYAAPTGTMFAYVDHERAVHLLSPSGTPIKTLKMVERPQTVVISAEGDRVGVVGDVEMRVYDARGEEVGAFGIDRDMTTFVLRGEEAWVGGNNGVIQHYKDGAIVASTPAHATELQLATLGRNALAVIASDSTLTIVRADAAQVTYDAPVCEQPTYTAHGIATGYQCGSSIALYVGRERVGEYSTADVELVVDYEPTSHRAAVAGASGVVVFERGAQIARTDKLGPARFAGPDQLYVVEPDKHLWRWTPSTDAWEPIMAIGEVYAITTIGTTVVLGSSKGEVTAIDGKAVTHRLSVGDVVGALVPSWDGRWLAVQLSSGATSIIDTRLWQVVRTLPAADNYGAAPSFDATGELLLRTSRQALSIWERATGEELVFGFDLMRELSNARFLPDGRIEINTREPGLLDIPRDIRPISEILGDIECRVPFAVVGSRIEPSTTACP